MTHAINCICEPCVREYLARLALNPGTRRLMYPKAKPRRAAMRIRAKRRP